MSNDCIGCAKPWIIPANSQQFDQAHGEPARIHAFRASGNRLVPTQEAMDIYRDSEPIFKMMLSFSRRLADVRDTRVGSLRLLATPPIANAVVPSALRSFKSTRPDVSVSFDVHRTEGVIDGVESGRADLGVSLEPYVRPGLEFELIGPGRWCAPSSPGIRSAQIRIYPRM